MMWAWKTSNTILVDKNKGLEKKTAQAAKSSSHQ